MSSRVNLVSLALDHVLTIHEHLEDKKGKKFRSRARELPSLILDVGLVPALLFYISKTDTVRNERGENRREINTYQIAVSVIRCGSQSGTTDNLRLKDDDKYAYSTIARAVLCALKELGYLDRLGQQMRGREYSIDSLEEVIEFLRDLRGKELELQATFELMDYLVSFKRAAEALWRSGGE